MYVDAWHNKKEEQIHVVLRENGVRNIKIYPAEYVFYYEDPNGKYNSIFREKVTRMEARTSKDLRKQKAILKGRKTFESDYPALQRCLENHFRNQLSPDLHVGFIDIEADYDEELGFSSPEEAFNMIIAITVYLQWCEKLITLAVKPKHQVNEEELAKYVESEDVFIFDSEREMLDTFLSLLDDVDVITGWNSTTYDLPYLVNRIKQILGREEARRFCLFDQQPEEHRFEKFGEEVQSFNLIGRVHLDYLELYRKYTYHELPSYRLDAVGEYELGETKVQYEGTLDHLYKTDFVKYLQYNRQDVLLLAKIDAKLKFISLVNDVAHSLAIPLDSALSPVAVTDQSIVVMAHDMGKILSDRKAPTEDRQGRVWLTVPENLTKSVANMGADWDNGRGMFFVSREKYVRDRDSWRDYIPSITAAGAYVARPKKGIHEWIGAVDINSLYPSVLRALNMSAETIVGQLRPVLTNKMINEKILAGAESVSECWDSEFGSREYQAVMEKDSAQMITIDWEDGNSDTLTADMVYELIFNSDSQWVLSGNGTIFTTQYPGIIATLLTSWYAARQAEQKVKKSFTELLSGYAWKADENILKQVASLKSSATPVVVPNRYNFKLEELSALLASNQLQEAADFLKANDLEVRDGKAYPLKTSEKSYKLAEEYWDRKQLITKIKLNSLYGALLNAGCRMFDMRLGQSTTLTGRIILRHMLSHINQTITGEYNPKGDAIIYGDTDSCYFTAQKVFEKDIEAGKIEWNKDTIIEIYDQIAEEVSKSFGRFMHTSFNTNLEQECVIKCGRELIGERGLFITKKRYAINVFDLEGKRQDVNGKTGKLKVMGLDIKRSDTPKFVQVFLEDVLKKLLDGNSYTALREVVAEFQRKIRELPNWAIGTPKRVNNLTRFGKKGGNMPGHVRASLNWNDLRRMNGDKMTMEIKDGQKIIVCKVKNNPMGYTSVAYPIDEMNLPDWFKELPFDREEMEEAVLFKKLDNIFRVLEWNFRDVNNAADEFFSF